jgi:hypothetical protein
MHGLDNATMPMMPMVLVNDKDSVGLANSKPVEPIAAPRPDMGTWVSLSIEAASMHREAPMAYPGVVILARTILPFPSTKLTS